MIRVSIFTLLVSAMLFSGCAWNRVAMNDATIVDRTKNIVIGKTKASQLAAILRAEPSMKLPTKAGTTLYSYAFSDTKTKAVSFIIVTFSKSNTTMSTLYIEVGADGIVKNIHRPFDPPPKWEYWPFDKDKK